MQFRMKNLNSILIKKTTWETIKNEDKIVIGHIGRFEEQKKS